MRGTPHHIDHGAPELGIIPAYAGNTTADDFKASADSGSSPRMRGTLNVQQTATGSVGIIPAYAGNTLHAFFES